MARAAYQAAMRVAPGYVSEGWQRQESDSSQMTPTGAKIYRKASAAVVRDPTTSPFKTSGVVQQVSPMTLAMIVTEKLSDIQVQQTPLSRSLARTELCAWLKRNVDICNS